MQKVDFYEKYPLLFVKNYATIHRSEIKVSPLRAYAPHERLIFKEDICYGSGKGTEQQVHEGRAARS